MEKCLLSIDWDYFVYTKENWGSYTENKKSLIDFWYKRYLNARFRGLTSSKISALRRRLAPSGQKSRNAFTLKIILRFMFRIPMPCHTRRQKKGNVMRSICLIPIPTLAMADFRLLTLRLTVPTGLANCLRINILIRLSLFTAPIQPKNRNASNKSTGFIILNTVN